MTLTYDPRLLKITKFLISNIPDEVAKPSRRQKSFAKLDEGRELEAASGAELQLGAITIPAGEKVKVIELWNDKAVCITARGKKFNITDKNWELIWKKVHKRRTKLKAPPQK
jgi:hypothetical protein